MVGMRSDLRGRCHELASDAVQLDPTLRLVRGWYRCPVWGDQQHWWAEREDGTIIDPTAAQFPSAGVGRYIEYQGMLPCEQCGDAVAEDVAYLPGNGMAFCSLDCYGRCIGF